MIGVADGPSDRAEVGVGRVAREPDGLPARRDRDGDGRAARRVGEDPQGSAGAKVSRQHRARPRRRKWDLVAGAQSAHRRAKIVRAEKPRHRAVRRVNEGSRQRQEFHARQEILEPLAVVGFRSGRDFVGEEFGDGPGQVGEVASARRNRRDAVRQRRFEPLVEPAHTENVEAFELLGEVVSPHQLHFGEPSGFTNRVRGVSPGSTGRG